MSSKPTPPKLAKGMKRQWLRCRTCSGVAYYDYHPYSLSTPLMATPCGHGAGERDLGCDHITESEAIAARAQGGAS